MPADVTYPDLPDIPAGTPVTHAHRTALRRIERGESVGDLGGVLGALYLHDLIRDGIDGRPMLSEDGRRVLAAHDQLGETRRVERPRLKPRPLPPGWRIHLGRGYVHEVHGLYSAVAELDDRETLARRLELVRDTLALLEWIEHSHAFEAQEAQGGDGCEACDGAGVVKDVRCHPNGEAHTVVYYTCPSCDTEARVETVRVETGTYTQPAVTESSGTPQEVITEALRGER